jgi:hypothetical protein
VLNIVLPSLAFWGGLAILAAEGAGWATVSRWLTARTGFEQALLVGVAIAGLLLFSFFPASLEAERKLWGALKQQLYQRGTDDPSVLELTVDEGTPGIGE